MPFGFGKDIGRVAEFRCLNHHPAFKVKDVLRPKQVETTRTLAELLVVEGVVVRASR